MITAGLARARAQEHRASKRNALRTESRIPIRISQRSASCCRTKKRNAPPPRQTHSCAANRDVGSRLFSSSGFRD